MDYRTLWDCASHSAEAAANQPPRPPQRVGQYSEGAAVPAREQMMKTASGQAGSNAAVALWRISRNAPLAVPVLVKALRVKSTNYAHTWRLFRCQYSGRDRTRSSCRGGGVERLGPGIQSRRCKVASRSQGPVRHGAHAAAVALIRLEDSANEAVPVVVEANSRDMSAQIVAGRVAGSLSPAVIPGLVSST